MGGFKSFEAAAITLAGIELAHRIRKRQFSFGRGRYRNFGSLSLLLDCRRVAVALRAYPVTRKLRRLLCGCRPMGAVDRIGDFCARAVSHLFFVVLPS